MEQQNDMEIADMLKVILALQIVLILVTSGGVFYTVFGMRLTEHALSASRTAAAQAKLANDNIKEMKKIAEQAPDAKILTCRQEYNNGDGDHIQREWQAIFETDDFSKENPMYEYVLLMSTKNNKPIESSMVGKKYRYHFEVTASTLSFEFCGNENLVNTNCAFPDGYSLLRSVSVSRTDLTVRNGQCSIADYGPSNLI